MNEKAYPKGRGGGGITDFIALEKKIGLAPFITIE